MKLSKMTTMVFIFTSIALQAEPTPWQKKFNSYVKDLPKDVVLYLERSDSCNHWSGEEPYDEARKNEILAALKTHNCDALESDQGLLLKKYEKQPKIIEKIKKFPSAIE